MLNWSQSFLGLLPVLSRLLMSTVFACSVIEKNCFLRCAVVVVVIAVAVIGSCLIITLHLDSRYSFVSVIACLEEYYQCACKMQTVMLD